MDKNKKIVFLTGTRADFGKLKPLINKIEGSENFENYVFVTGMHTLSKYGSTYDEVRKQKYKEMYIFMNQTHTTAMDIILANTIIGFSNFINEIKPDMIVVHGDRVEALAGAIVGSLNNILVAHIEGGEISGTIDELIRHSITKLSHIHFVANKEAKKRLIQMGEIDSNIYVIGSPDIDIMYSDNLPTIDETKKHYEIPWEDYSLCIYHPVTTEQKNTKKDIKQVLTAAIESDKKYVVIYPNNDTGSDDIIKEIDKLYGNDNFKIFPSIRFEHFLTLLKNSDFIMGNSSVGSRVSEIYGIPSINIGSRQKNRSKSNNIINVNPIKEDILDGIEQINTKKIIPISHFGEGKSSENFYNILTDDKIWNTKIQKQFYDLPYKGKQ